MTKERGECGGFYIPLRFPEISAEVRKAFHFQSFDQRIAEILNLFFRTDLKGRELELAVGKLPIRIAAMHHKIAILENWHNPEGSYSGFLKQLYSCTAKENAGSPGTWFRIAVRIACLFAAFADMQRMEITVPIDIAMAGNCFEDITAAVYATKMGLPVGKVILARNDDDGIWELLHHGALEAENLPALAGLETVIFEILGPAEARKFAAACNGQETYRILEDQLSRLNRVLFCAVIRQPRTESIIHNIYHTNSYLMNSATAMAYGGLQDYRASHKETGPAWILSDRMPTGTSR